MICFGICDGYILQRCEKYQVTHAECKYNDHNLKFDMPPRLPPPLLSYKPKNLLFCYSLQKKPTMIDMYGFWYISLDRQLGINSSNKVKMTTARLS